MSDLCEPLGDRYETLASAISETVSDWLGHDTPRNPHGWRCEDKTRYPGPCGCDGEMADEVMAVLGDVLPGLLAQAWDEGQQAADEAGWLPSYIREDMEVDNPYRQETGE